MKSTLFAAVSLLALASAQPAHRHRAMHQKKDAVTIVNTVIAQATAEPVVIVYVDDTNKPVSTTTQNAASILYTNPGSVPSAPASVAAPAVLKEKAPIASTTLVPATSTAPAKTADAPAQSSSAAPATGSSGGVSASGNGVTYGPYKGSAGTCKSAAEVLKDFDSLPAGVGFVRTYGTDCNTVATVYAACKAKGLKLIVGVFSPATTLASDLATIKAGVNGDWSNVLAVTIGNELVDSGAASASSVVGWVNSARSTLRGYGYTGPVSTVDTLVATRSNPSLCDNSDICSVNCHPFFDSATAAAGAGAFITTQVATLQAKLANKNQQILITETGWPAKGDANGAAVPSSANQVLALTSIKTAFAANPAGVTLFSPFNMPWKQPGPFNAEPWWGFQGDAPSG